MNRLIYGFVLLRKFLSGLIVLLKFVKISFWYMLMCSFMSGRLFLLYMFL